MLRLVVRRGLFDEDQARGMLQSPHSGFHVHAGVGVPEDDRAFAVGVEQVTHRSDKTAGPTAVAGPPSPA